MIKKKLYQGFITNTKTTLFTVGASKQNEIVNINLNNASAGDLIVKIYVYGDAAANLTYTMTVPAGEFTTIVNPFLPLDAGDIVAAEVTTVSTTDISCLITGIESDV